MASVDSIAFRLHNLQAYPQLIWTLTRKKTFGFTRETAYTPRPDMLPIEVINATFLDGTKSQQKKFNYVHYAPSHLYQMVVLVDEVQDYADFKLSLPKFMFGHNVQMLFNVCPSDDPIDSINEGWDGFITAMNSLLFRLLEGDYGLRDVTIGGIDICMNSKRRSQEASYAEIEKFKSNRMLHQRINGETFSQFKTTVMRRTADWTFKIYHKGDEFKKHDFKKVAKYDLKLANDLQAIADETLRCETTFRKTFLSKLYHDNYSTKWMLPFRHYQEDPNKFGKMLEDEYLTILPSGMTVAGTMAMLGADIENPYRSKSHFKQAAKKIGLKLNRNLEFYLNGSSNFDVFGVAEHQALFDKNFYGILVKTFQNHINSMTLNAEHLSEDTPDDVVRYHKLGERFSDDELQNIFGWKKETLYVLRAERRKALTKKTTGNSILNMSAFNRIMFPESNNYW